MTEFEQLVIGKLDELRGGYGALSERLANIEGKIEGFCNEVDTVKDSVKTITAESKLANGRLATHDLEFGRVHGRFAIQRAWLTGMMIGAGAAGGGVIAAIQKVIGA